MVYYPALPLIMKPENKDVQICTPLGGDTQKYPSSPPQQHEHPLLQHRQVTNNNGTTLNQTTNLSISCGQGFLHTVKTEQMQQVSLIQQMHLESQSNTSNSFAIQNGEKFHFKCEKCNMIFGSKSAHTSHMKSHSNQDNNFHTVIPTSEHLSTTSGSDPYQCNVCKKTFAVPARLIRHYRTHTGERPFECEFCHKMFSVKENLQVHRRIHTKERPYKCDICGRAFEHSGKLHRHMRIHTGERPHKCSVCSKTFIQSGQLVIHMRTHTGEKPYKCPVEGCGKGFTCSKQLKVHSRTHTGEKPYHCDICFRDFGYNHVLKLHRVQHYGSKCYKCTICDETFKSKKEMEAHIKGHANEIRDEEEENTSQPSQSSVKQESIQYREPPPKEKSLDNTSLSAITTATFDTPQESGSDPTSDNGEEANNYYNIYQIFDEPQQGRGVDFSLRTRSINPALLAAASLASRKVDESPAAPSTTLGYTFSPAVLNITTLPTQMDVISNSTGINEVNISYKQSSLVVHKNTATSSNSFVYEPLSVMRQQGYFAPAPVPEYRPSLRAANDIVRRVEAAIAGAEPLITPPRSSTESPDRSLSPESDSMLMADRDVMTLPLRKRKVYLTDNQSSHDVPPAVRMNSVIQFARAS